MTFSAYISDSALLELERQEMLKDARFISFVSFEDDRIILEDVRDGARDKFVEVQLRDKKTHVSYRP